MKRLWCCVFVGLLFMVASAAAEEPSPATTAAAHALEARLIAPCCWRETLDIHQSPIADQLRRELRERLARGESIATIEADLVTRYGPKIRATLPGSLGYLLFGMFLLGGLATLVALGVRTSRKTSASAPADVAPSPTPPPPSAQRERQKYEDQLDDDLASG